MRLESTLEKEAQEQLATTQRSQIEPQEQVHTYNNAVRSINNCLQQMQVDRYQLPLVEIVSPSVSKIANIQTQEVIVDS